MGTKDIDKVYGGKKPIYSTNVTPTHANKLMISPRDAHYADYELVPIEIAKGKISADLLMIYPPGISSAIPRRINFRRSRSTILLLL